MKKNTFFNEHLTFDYFFSKTKLFFMVLFLGLIGVQAQVYVDASATGANNGNSWADAFTDLQSALAQSGQTTIWIASGTYTPGNNRSAMFTITDGKKLFGGFDGTETMLSQRDIAKNITKLSGDINANDTSNVDYNLSERSDNSYRVVYVNSSSVVLDGLTISNAHLDDASTTGIQNGSAIVMQANTTISNCTIENNVSHYGGSISLAGNNTNTTLLIQNSVIRNNLAPFAVAFYSTIKLSSNIRLVNTVIHNNECKAIGSTATYNNTIWLQESGSSSVANDLGVINCTFTNNTFTGTGTKELVRSDHDGFGGSPSFEFINNIFWNNSTGNVRAFHIGSGSANQIILFSNNDQNNFSNILNSAASFSSNISSDPLFVNNGIDFKLSFNSPCLDAGSSVSYNNNATSQIDANGNARIQGPSIDIGAYEGGNPFVSNVVVYVDQNANGNNDGSSWINAYTDLQSALSFTAPVNIWIASGTYTPGTSRAATFNLVKQFALYGGFNGTETMLSQRNPILNPTILSGDINGDDAAIFSTTDPKRSENSYRVIEVNARNVIIDGLSIINGNANGSTSSDKEGSGINVNSTDLNINNCKFNRHTLTRGGIISSIDVAGAVNITINKTTFKNNQAGFATVYYGRAESSLNINFESCLFTNNTSVGSSLIWLRQDTSGSHTGNIINSTFANNLIDNSNVITYLRADGGTTQANIYNSLFWNNTDSLGANINALQTGSNGFVANSIANDGFTSNSNTSNTSSLNPLFSDAANGDYTVQMTSPAIDTGDNNIVTAVTDLLGNDRIFNATVDMGAYEFGAGVTLSNSDFIIETVGIKLYPNPTSSILNIESTNQQIERVEIYDILGKQILKTNQKEINVSNLKGGIYILKAKTTLGEVVKRFIKQ